MIKINGKEVSENELVSVPDSSKVNIQVSETGYEAYESEKVITENTKNVIRLQAQSESSAEREYVQLTILDPKLYGYQYSVDGAEYVDGPSYYATSKIDKLVISVPKGTPVAIQMKGRKNLNDINETITVNEDTVYTIAPTQKTFTVTSAKFTEGNSIGYEGGYLPVDITVEGEVDSVYASSSSGDIYMIKDGVENYGFRVNDEGTGYEMYVPELAEMIPSDDSIEVYSKSDTRLAWKQDDGSYSIIRPYMFPHEKEYATIKGSQLSGIHYLMIGKNYGAARTIGTIITAEKSGKQRFFMKVEQAGYPRLIGFHGFCQMNFTADGIRYKNTELPINRQGSNSSTPNLYTSESIDFNVPADIEINKSNITVSDSWIVLSNLTSGFSFYATQRSKIDSLAVPETDTDRIPPLESGRVREYSQFFYVEKNTSTSPRTGYIIFPEGSRFTIVQDGVSES